MNPDFDSSVFLKTPRRIAALATEMSGKISTEQLF
jgi:hypothetical protein